MKLRLGFWTLLGCVIALPHSHLHLSSNVTADTHLPPAVNTSTTGMLASAYSFGSLTAILSEQSVPFSFQTATGIVTISEALFSSDAANGGMTISMQHPTPTSTFLWQTASFEWPIRSGPPVHFPASTTLQGGMGHSSLTSTLESPHRVAGGRQLSLHYLY
ncbi:hypothetical protein HJFPF1_09273 [Paramyrothecium foliicola]|nr:hypothetical protein HJFPF1_09273 [Paramyrothecium foliicola]